MIRAASIPHLGQTTPIAALGLRAIRSLLTRLDANGPPTVLNIPTPSARRRDEAESVWKGFAISLQNASKLHKENRARTAVRVTALCLTFVDTTVTGPTFPSPVDRPLWPREAASPTHL